MPIIEDVYIPARKHADDVELNTWIETTTGKTHPPELGFVITPKPITPKPMELAPPIEPQPMDVSPMAPTSPQEAPAAPLPSVTQQAGQAIAGGLSTAWETALNAVFNPPIVQRIIGYLGGHPTASLEEAATNSGVDPKYIPQNLDLIEQMMSMAHGAIPTGVRGSPRPPAGAAPKPPGLLSSESGAINIRGGISTADAKTAPIHTVTGQPHPQTVPQLADVGSAVIARSQGQMTRDAWQPLMEQQLGRVLSPAEADTLYAASTERFNKIITGVIDASKETNLKTAGGKAPTALPETPEGVRAGLPQTQDLLDLISGPEGIPPGADWYHGAWEELQKTFGPDAGIVAQFIAATSPVTRTPKNVAQGISAYRQWKTGKPFDLPSDRFAHAKRPNLERAASGEELSGQKVQNFLANIAGDPQAITVDRWMANIFGLGKDVTKTEYGVIAEWIRQEAANADLSPRDFQAALWVGQKLQAGLGPGESLAPLKDLIAAEVAKNRRSLSALMKRQAGEEELAVTGIFARMVAGAIGGSFVGDTPEERLRNAAIGMGLGVVASPALIKRAAGMISQGIRGTMEGAQPPAGESPLARIFRGEAGGIDLGATGEPSRNVPRPRQPVVEMPVSEIKTDPERFQYKVARGEGGATGSLSGARTFDPNFAGVVQVWTDPADGMTYVVNGHNRLALAKESGRETIDVRHLVADTAEEARTIGAMTNVAEGRGNAIDAAKLFRDTGMGIDEVRARGINLKEKVAADGLALANLHDTLFNEVVQGTLPMERALIIGSRVADHDQQLKLVQLMRAKGRTITNRDTRELADFVQSAPSAQVTQETLFGAEESTVSLALDKAKIAAAIRERLSTDKSLFGRVGKTVSAERLTEAGNIINVEASQQQAQQSAQLLQIFDHLKYAPGDIGDILNEAATRLHAGEPINAVTNTTYAQLKQALPEAIAGAESQGLGSSVGGAGELTTSTGDVITATAARTPGRVSEAGIPIRAEAPAVVGQGAFDQPPHPGAPAASPVTPEGAATPSPAQPSVLEQAYASPGRFNPTRQAASSRLRMFTAEINVLARDLGLMEQQTRGTVSFDEIKEGALRLITSGQMSAERIVSFEPGTILTAEEGTAARMIRDAAMKHADRVERLAANGDAAAKGQLVSTMYLASTIEAATEAASGTEPARALSARRIASRPTGTTMGQMQEILKALQEEPLSPEAIMGVDKAAASIQKALVDASEQATTPQGKAAIDALTQEVSQAIATQPDPGQLLGGLWQTMLKGAMRAEDQALDPDLLNMVMTKTQDAITNAVPPGHLLAGLWDVIYQAPLDAALAHVEQTVDPDLLLTFTRQLVTAGEKKAFTDYFAHTTKTGRWLEAVLEARNAGLLTVRSLVRNIVGSGAATVWSIPERAITAVTGEVFGTKDGAYAHEAIDLMHGMIHSQIGALHAAGRALKTGESQVFQEANMLERGILPAISADALGLTGTPGRFADVLGELIRWDYRGLTAGDDYLKYVNAEAQKYALAYRRYRTLQTLGMPEAQAAEEYATLIKTPPTWLREQTRGYSLYQTFNDDIINPLGKLVMQARNLEGPAGLLMKTILPFARTPMNVAGFGAERTLGLNALSWHWWQEMMAGGVRRDAALGNLALGSSVLGIFAYYAANGWMNGRGPKEPNLRRQMIENGWVPYSINLPGGGKPISFLGISPLSEILGQAGDFGELVNQGAEWPQLTQIAGAMVLSSMNVMQQYPMLRGLADISAAIQQTDTKSEGVILQTLASAMPAPGLQGVSRLTASLTDPYLRETRSPHGRRSYLAREVDDLMEELMSRTPWRENYEYVKRDTLERPMMREGGWWTVLPLARSAQEPHPVLTEMNTHKIAVGLPTKAFGKGRERLGVMDDEGVDTSAVILKPNEWARYRELIGRIDENGTIDGPGKTMVQALEAEIASPDYNKDGDGPRGGKADRIKAIFSDYRGLAKDKLQEEFPELAQLIKLKADLADYEKMDQADQDRARPGLTQRLGHPPNIGLLR